MKQSSNGRDGSIHGPNLHKRLAELNEKHIELLKRIVAEANASASYNSLPEVPEHNGKNKL